MKVLRLEPLPLFCVGKVDTFQMPDKAHLPGISIWLRDCKVAVSSDPPTHPNFGGAYLAMPVLLNAGNAPECFQFMPPKGAVVTVIALEAGNDFQASAVLSLPCVTEEDCRTVEKMTGLDNIRPHPVIGFRGPRWVPGNYSGDPEGL